MLEFARFRERLLRSRSRVAAYTELAALALASFPAGTPPADVARAAATADAQLRAAVLPAMELRAQRRERPAADQHGGGGDAQQPLQFNDDLATRPAWLPPEPCRPGLALAVWWARQDAAPEPQRMPGVIPVSRLLVIWRPSVLEGLSLTWLSFAVRVMNRGIPR